MKNCLRIHFHRALLAKLTINTCQVENVKRLEDMIYWWLKMPDLDKRNPGLLVVDRMYPDHLDSCPAVDHGQEEQEPELEEKDSGSSDEDLITY